jgi:restriction system protein
MGAQHEGDPGYPLEQEGRGVKGLGRALTIVEAIAEVMKRHGASMTVDEVYRGIVGAGLYSFKADDPQSVVRSQIRRHCLGVDFPSASARKHFKLEPEGKYVLLDAVVRHSAGRMARHTRLPSKDSVAEVQVQYDRYLQSFRQRALDSVNQLKAAEFERFCRNLLTAYGFREVKVTRTARDGGIDGHGRLKVGFAFFNVAFQCKKWRCHSSVGRPEIDQFRGAIQGQFEHLLYHSQIHSGCTKQCFQARRGHDSAH